MVDRKPPGDRARAPARPPLQLYDIFVKVADARSFVGASKLVGISQPAVSQAIARLEDFYPGDLFVRRRGASLALTPVGEALLPHARAMLRLADRSFIQAEAASKSESGRLSIGFYTGIARGALRGAISAFRDDCPDVELHLVEAMPRELHAQLCDHAIDLVIAAFMPELGASGIAQECLWSEELVSILPEGHELANVETLSWADIARFPIILRSAGGDLSGYRAIIAGVGPRAVTCAQYPVSRGTLLQLVAMGFGITISFSSAVVVTPGVITVPIRGERATASVEAIWHTDDANPIRHRFLRHLREAAESSRQL